MNCLLAGSSRAGWSGEVGQWLGQLGYSLPVGTSGLRGRLSHAHTYYERGKQFADLDATGTADIRSVGLTYPWLRSQRSNVTVDVSMAWRDRGGAPQSDTVDRQPRVWASIGLRF